MPNISSIIKNVRNIMRQDRGVSGDAQRLEQLGWLLFLKILDERAIPVGRNERRTSTVTHTPPSR